MKKVKPLIKICGIRTKKEARWLGKLVVNMAGFNFYVRSPRYIAPFSAKKIIAKLKLSIKPVGVFVDEEKEKIVETAKYCKLKLVQLHGNESPEFCIALRKELPKGIKIIKAFRIKDKKDLCQINYFLKPKKVIDLALIDSYKKGVPGGTGKKMNLKLAMQVSSSVPLILAGGLNPGNVKQIINKSKPYAVDVASGVEEVKNGKVVKSFKKMKAFIMYARS